MAIRRKNETNVEIDVDIIMDTNQNNKIFYKFPFDTLQDLSSLNSNEIKELLESIVLGNDKRVQDFLLSQESQKQIVEEAKGE